MAVWEDVSHEEGRDAAELLLGSGLVCRVVQEDNPTHWFAFLYKRLGDGGHTVIKTFNFRAESIERAKVGVSTELREWLSYLITQA